MKKQNFPSAKQPKLRGSVLCSKDAWLREWRARARVCGSKSRDEGDRPPPPVCVPAQDPIEQALTPRDDVGANERETERGRERERERTRCSRERKRE
mgnify:CR=1 FL=1